VAAVAAVFVLWLGFLQFFPNEAACVASGRTVDPTHRHCESASGYVQLRGHVILHSLEAMMYFALAGGIVVVGRYVRRMRRRPA
jgi:hypothetical protein